MRDHRKLKAFIMADALVLNIYKVTRSFPKEELFGLVSQMRRAAISSPSNIVEGCARHTESEYLRFLDIAYGSAKELEYQLSVAYRLDYMKQPDYEEINNDATEVSKVLNGLINSLRN